ncbi:MAG: hypothetical protein ABSE49_25845, partial [Polyangiaceae bacterium]
MTPCPTRSRGSRFARRLLTLSPFLLVAGAALCDPSGASAAAPAAAAAVTSNGLVTLPGSVHPLIRTGTDLGRLDPARRLPTMSVVFKPSASQKADIDRTLLA